MYRVGMEVHIQFWEVEGLESLSYDASKEGTQAS